MMEMIRGWLLGVTCAAIIAALCDSLTPPGAVRRVGRLAGGLLLMIAILRPLVGMDYDAMAGMLADYRARAAGYGQALDTENTKIMKAIIAEQTSAYIQDKADSLGMDCTVAVSCEFGGQNFPVPVAVTITGQFTQEQEKALRRAIEGDFAIPPDAQTYERTEHESD